MATLIPAVGSCKFRTSGERRFAERLEDKLEEDYLCWYEVSVRALALHPDFVIFHPGRGLLVLEVKDWKLDSLLSINRQQAQVMTPQGAKQQKNPLEQAREYVFAVKDTLERDVQLVHSTGPQRGRLIFPYAYGAVLANISRKQFDATNLGEVLPAHLVICQDEMTETVANDHFQERLWAMFPVKFPAKLSLPQIDRVRWNLFPEIRIGAICQMAVGESSEPAAVPDVVRVMDLQQEKLARSLGEGHRVIHGVAGSGKTLILGYRAELLAKSCQRPILVLCYNKTLAAQLESVMHSKGVAGKVSVMGFHAWCIRQLRAYNVGLPAEQRDKNAFFEACVDRLIRSVDAGHIPHAQYDAVLIDEGHDFRPEWFKLVVQMIHPDSKSLLVLYDDAQSIYGGPRKMRFSFSRVGVQAKGRTTILKLNYRNSAEIFAVARAFADDLLSEHETVEDTAPTVSPSSCGRHGPHPVLVELPDLHAEADYVAHKLSEANRLGVAWSDMAVIYRRSPIARQIAQTLERNAIPFQWPQMGGDKYTPDRPGIKLLTMHSSKGLEFPFVCIPGLGVEVANDDLREETRLLYVAMTRATRDLVMTHSGNSSLAQKVQRALDALQPAS